MRLLTKRRLALAVLATAVAGGGLPLLTSSPASADVPASITVTPVSGSDSVSAGTCALYKVTARDAVGSPIVTETRDTKATITVSITESPNSATQDVDFCTLTGDDGVVRGDAFQPGGRPSYTNAPPAPSLTAPQPSGTPQSYTPGSSVTPGSSGGGGMPDVADSGSPVNGANNNNPAGVDQAGLVVESGTDYYFGVAGLVPGGATINVFADQDGDGQRDTATTNPVTGATTGPTETAAQQRTLNITAGGAPGSIQARDAVASVVATPDLVVGNQPGPGSEPATFTVTTKNGSGNTVAGVPVDLAVDSGPNAATTANPGGTYTASCGSTNNDGQVVCSYQGVSPGDDQVTVFVNQSKGSPTQARDSGEPSDSVTVRNVAPPAQAAEARYVDLSPDTATTVAGQSRDFTALVTAADGRPAAGVDLVFTEAGPGVFKSGSGTSSTVAGRTGSTGLVTVTVLTAAGESGVETVAVNITTAGTRCADAATTRDRAGNCADTSANTVTAPASPSPSPSKSPSPSPSATPTASTSPKPSPSASVSPPGAVQCASPLGIALDRGYITPGVPVRVTVTAPAGAQIELQAYSRPSTEFNQVRRAVVGEAGTASFDVTPGTNTRLFADCIGQSDSVSPQKVINVRTALSLTVVRNGRRDYTFKGRILPRRADQLITLYRVEKNGQRVVTKQLRTDSTGTYSFRRVFTGSGTFGFLTRTGQTLTNASGESGTPNTAAGQQSGVGKPRPTAIY